MKIAFDIDDTLGDLLGPVIEFFNQMYTKEYTKDSLFDTLKKANYSYTDSPLALAYDISLEKVNSIFREHGSSIHSQCIAFPNALKLATKYYNEGHEIFYITARDGSLYDLTLDWLRQNGFPDGTLYHESGDKSVLAEQLGIDVFYEDNINNALLIHARGIKTYLIDSSTNYHDIDGIERIIWSKWEDVK